MHDRMMYQSQALLIAATACVSVIAVLLLLVSIAAAAHVTVAPPRAVAVVAEATPAVAPVAEDYLAGLTEKKRRFVTILAKAIDHQNQRIQAQRQQLLQVFSRVVGGAAMSEADAAMVASIAAEYDVDTGQGPDETVWNELFRRVDVIPPSLALSQAATESGWGTSRLARQNNNYFGERCFARGCGEVPPQRAAGDTHEIADFASVEDSVQSYFRNINTHVAYEPLRKLRMQQRLKAQPLEGTLLADGLQNYSVRGDSYVEYVKSMIRTNRLDLLDQAIVSSEQQHLLSSAATQDDDDRELAAR